MPTTLALPARVQASTVAPAVPTAETGSISSAQWWDELRLSRQGGQDSRLSFCSLVVGQLVQKYALEAGLAQDLVSQAEAAGVVAASSAFAKRLGARTDELELLLRYWTTASAVELLPRIYALPDSAVEGTRPLLLRSVLSEDDVRLVLDAVQESAGASLPPSGCTDLAAFPQHARFGSAHAAFYLHRGGFWERRCPQLSARLVRAMRTQPRAYFSPQLKLSIRTVEFHTYVPGDGLSVPGHRDKGSLLTMSVLLTEPDEVEGGAFTTYADGARVAHPIGRRDAILFHSEKMHNVQPVSRGVRHALVVELWQGKPNAHDRFK